MPTKLLVVIVILGLSLALDLYKVTGESGDATGIVRIVLNLVLLYGLISGQEWARMMAKVMAILSLIAAGFIAIQLLTLGTQAFAIPSLAILAFLVIGLATVYGVFLLWTMNQVDVQEWLMARKLRG